jgi:hypothetical protein
MNISKAFEISLWIFVISLILEAATGILKIFFPMLRSIIFSVVVLSLIATIVTYILKRRIRTQADTMGNTDMKSDPPNQNSFIRILGIVLMTFGIINIIGGVCFFAGAVIQHFDELMALGAIYGILAFALGIFFFFIGYLFLKAPKKQRT